jgi:hypothetical protein
MLLPLSLVNNRSRPRRNFPARSPGTNIAEGERKVQSSASLLAQQIKEDLAGRGLRLVYRRKLRGIDQFHARSDFKAAGSAHHQIGGNAGLTHGGNQLVWIAGGKMDRTDDCVTTLDGPGKPGDVTSVGLQRGYAR